MWNFTYRINFAAIPGQPQQMMPRKSARLLSKTKVQPQSTDSDDFLHKRRRMADVEQRNFFVANGRQHFRIQNNRLPISQTHAITTSMIVPSDETDSLACPESLPLPQPASAGGSWEEEEVVHVFTTPLQQRQLFRFSNHFQRGVYGATSLNPLPCLEWADSQEVWEAMKQKEAKYTHSMNMFLQHPDIKTNMRAVLFTWLTEVCEVYKLHKETYYLAVNFIDRFLLATEKIKTSKLQLVGVTALFMASKIEEIYPPKSTEFAYVADGAFEVPDIHEFELIMLKALKWHLSPMTLNSWIQLYLQIAASQERAAQQAASKSPSPCTMQAKSPCDIDTSANSPCDLDTSASSASDPDTVAHSHHEHHISSCSPCDLDTLVPSSSRDLDISAYSACTLDTSRNSGVSELVVCAGGMDLVGAADAEDDGDGDDEEYEPSAEDGGSETDSGDDMDVTEEQKAIVEQNIVHPFYSPHVYLQVSQLIDLVVLDSHSLQFKYSVLAAAAVYHATDIEDICQVTCLTWEELEPCVMWMKNHKDIINKFRPCPAGLKTFENVSEAEAHKIQYHTVSKEMWEEALRRSESYFHARSSLALLAEAIQHRQQESPSPASPTPIFITPPRSSKKVSPTTSTRQ